ncbi:MAG: SPOR domain-containing protein [Gemmatimonadetes bacterium]|nr:SPOR domain-containing protein [Gemmatimonadota bacterium]
MRALPLFMVFLAAVGPVPVTAQQALQSVTALVSQGRSDQARRALIEWWNEEWPGASRRDKQHGLWMRARLTVDPGLAALDYQRLVVEYPGGPYSGQALYRLAQAAEARSDARGAARYFETLAKDYPASRHSATATAWLGRNPVAVAELRSKEVAVTAEAPKEAPEEAPLESGGYAVQLGAFSDATGARRIADRAEAEGFSVRMVRVRGSQLVRVRVGRFENQEDALELLRRVRAGGFEVALVTDAAREDPIS